MAALLDVLAERRRRDDRLRRAREVEAAVPGAIGQDRVVPAGDVALRRTAAELVGVVLVVHQRGDAAPVVGPGRGDEVAIGVARRVAVLRRGEGDVAIGLEVREVGADERAVGVVQREHERAPGGIAEGACVEVGDIVGGAGVAGGIVDDRGGADEFDREVGGMGGQGEERGERKDDAALSPSVVPDAAQRRSGTHCALRPARPASAMGFGFGCAASE